MALRFGLRVPTAETPEDTAAYAAKVEAAGFDFMWMPDTPLLAGMWRDVYTCIWARRQRRHRACVSARRDQSLTRHPPDHGKRHRHLG